ncbi:MAG: hypothetical protein COC17_01510 [Hyphomicrobiales bacterium]|nr:hypothetical protein [Hyphomicrobiales bacterium]PCH51321.1 MAG: hypothetical protein COC17_01510 [Hyphomicrobiales bacterium]
MPDTNSSCPRCGFQEMRDISFWKNENHICAECGAYWKTISNEPNVSRVQHLKYNAKFGKRKIPNTEYIDRISSRASGTHRPSAVTDDFFDEKPEKNRNQNGDFASVNDFDLGYVSNRQKNMPQFRKPFLPGFSLVNITTFSVVALTLVSLPQIGLFSGAGQTIKEQVALLRGETGLPPHVDPIVTASITKAPKLSEEFRVGEIKFTRVAKGAQSHIVVHGWIRNISGNDARTKPLRIVMMDNGGVEVQSWVHMVRDTMLEPGKIMSFTSTVKAVGHKAKTVNVDVLN